MTDADYSNMMRVLRGIEDQLKTLNQSMHTLTIITQAAGWRASGVDPAQVGCGIQVLSGTSLGTTK